MESKLRKYLSKEEATKLGLEIKVPQEGKTKARYMVSLSQLEFLRSHAAYSDEDVSLSSSDENISISLISIFASINAFLDIFWRICKCAL